MLNWLDGFEPWVIKPRAKSYRLQPITILKSMTKVKLTYVKTNSKTIGNGLKKNVADLQNRLSYFLLASL